MRMILTIAASTLLAACSGTASENVAGNEAAPAANATAPADANQSKPDDATSSAVPVDPAANPRRANEIQECIADVRTEVPEGTDLNGFCGCAVDRMQGGARERDAMEACANEMGIQPRGH
jgi:hypothetical protein